MSIVCVWVCVVCVDGPTGPAGERSGVSRSGCATCAGSSSCNGHPTPPPFAAVFSSLFFLLCTTPSLNSRQYVRPAYGAKGAGSNLGVMFLCEAALGREASITVDDWKLTKPPPVCAILFTSCSSDFNTACLPLLGFLRLLLSPFRIEQANSGHLLVLSCLV